MLDILDGYLRENATPEMRIALVEAHDAFNRIELPNYEQEFEALLMMDGDADQGSTLASIVDLTRRFMTELLRMHEITLDPDTSLHMLTVFLNGILDIQNYDNYQTVIDTCSMDGNPQEKLAELLALVTKYTVEELLSCMEDVNFVLINRLKEMALQNDKPPLSVEEQGEINFYMDKLRRFHNYTMQAKLKILDLIKNGLPVGFPFLTYMGLIGREIEEMPVDLAAWELYAMALISNDGTNNPQGIIKEHLENYISDPNKLTKVDIKLREITLGMQR
jgi:hypothetical protein